MNLDTYITHPSAFADLSRYLPSSIEDAEPLAPQRVDTSWADLRSVENARVWDGNGRRAPRSHGHKTDYTKGPYAR